MENLHANTARAQLRSSCVAHLKPGRGATPSNHPKHNAPDRREPATKPSGTVGRRGKASRPHTWFLFTYPYPAWYLLFSFLSTFNFSFLFFLPIARVCVYVYPFFYLQRASTSSGTIQYESSNNALETEQRKHNTNNHENTHTSRKERKPPKPHLVPQELGVHLL